MLIKEKTKQFKIYNKDIINAESNLYLFLKRIIDIIFSLIGIIVLIPVFIIIATIVKLDSSGPILYNHSRLGKNKKKIRVIKFRTMVSNSEDIFKNLSKDKKEEYYMNFKLEEDPRITKVGHFLRKTSLDELPQLLNILIGNMTLVGPRPIVEKEVEKYSGYEDKLFSVKPGLTGLWQVSGRSDTTYEERVLMDIEYIDKKSIIMDFSIMLKTITAVIRKNGAM